MYAGYAAEDVQAMLQGCRLCCRGVVTPSLLSKARRCCDSLEFLGMSLRKCLLFDAQFRSSRPAV